VTRSLLTGGSGFVGANLARRLLDRGDDVHLLLRPGYRRWRIAAILPDIHIHEIDMFDGSSLNHLVDALRPDCIFHLAVHGAYPSQQNLDSMVFTNIIGTMNLVRAALATGFEVFVNTGSSSEYGLKDHPPSETEYLDPNSFYAVTKATATHFCRFTAREQKVRIPTLRLYSAYGPFEEPSRLIPQMVVRGFAGKLPPLVDPNVARDYVHVDDVVSAYLAVAEDRTGSDPGAVYNVGTGVQTTLAEVVATARKLLTIEAEPRWGTMKPRDWDTSTWVADSGRIRAELAWLPGYDFESGLRATIEWFRANPHMYAHYLDGSTST
jgi:UDP-glucose 4-epimerase